MSMSRLYTISTFSRQLATTMSSGVPIIEGIDAIAERTATNGFQQVLRSIRDDLKGGATVAAAFEKHPDWFPGIYRTMIRVGELGGNLPVILQRLSGFLDKAAQQQRKLFGGILLPSVVAMQAAVIGLHLNTHAVKQLGGVASPWLTSALVLGLVSSVWLLVILLSEGSGGWWLRVLSWIPSVKGMLVNLGMARFSRILGTMIGSGVPLSDALGMTAEHVGDAKVATALRRAQAGLQQGRDFVPQLRESGAFTPVMIQMVAAGVQTSKLNEALLRAADIYEAESDFAVDRLNRGAQVILTFAIAGGMALLVQGLVLSRLAGTMIR